MVLFYIFINVLRCFSLWAEGKLPFYSEREENGKVGHVETYFLDA
jgi:hypothetical protein